MASLTPLSKGLIGLVVIGGMASAVWHLYLKERLASPGAPASAITSPSPAAPSGTVAMPAPPSPAPAPTPTPSEAPAQASTATSASTVDENFNAGRSLIAAGDFAQARPRLEQALQQGSGAAACLLGEMTLKGQGGLAADQAKAAQLFQLAQSRGTICFTAGQ